MDQRRSPVGSAAFRKPAWRRGRRPRLSAAGMTVSFMTSSPERTTLENGRGTTIQPPALRRFFRQILANRSERTVCCSAVTRGAHAASQTEEVCEILGAHGLLRKKAAQPQAAKTAPAAHSAIWGWTLMEKEPMNTHLYQWGSPRRELWLTRKSNVKKNLIVAVTVVLSA